MVHLAVLIRRSFFKVYAAVVLVFLIIVGTSAFYIGQNQKRHTVAQSMEALLLAKEEAASVYIQFITGRPLPANFNPRFFEWMEHRPKLLPILPDMAITLDSIERSGRIFYEGLRPRPPQTTNTNVRAAAVPPNPAVVAQQYEAFKNNISTLMNPLSNYTYKPTPAQARLNGGLPFSKRLAYFIESFFPFGLGLLALFLMFVVFWASKGLLRRFRRRSDDILDLLWSALKEQNELSDTPRVSPESLQSNVYTLAGESSGLVRHIQTLKEALANMPSPQPAPAPAAVHSQDTEQLAYIQKLLARLFTRAERTAALAKASVGNGAQAGILALNISIEAARAGDAGRPFLAGADKIKDFGEKTSRIGDAILEEMKDADMAIRKAYAAGKNLLDAAPQVLEPRPEAQNITDDWAEGIVYGTEELLGSAERVQETARQLERGIEEFIEALKYQSEQPEEEGLPVREAVIQSFELLYFLSRGDTPPTHILKND